MKRLSLALMLLFSTTLCVVSTAQKHRNHLEKTEQTTATTDADTVGRCVAPITSSVDSDFDAALVPPAHVTAKPGHALARPGHCLVN